jgi:hypothetical protein
MAIYLCCSDRLPPTLFLRGASIVSGDGVDFGCCMHSAGVIRGCGVSREVAVEVSGVAGVDLASRPPWLYKLAVLTGSRPHKFVEVRRCKRGFVEFAVGSVQFACVGVARVASRPWLYIYAVLTGSRPPYFFVERRS